MHTHIQVLLLNCPVIHQSIASRNELCVCVGGEPDAALIHNPCRQHSPHSPSSMPVLPTSPLDCSYIRVLRVALHMDLALVSHSVLTRLYSFCQSVLLLLHSRSLLESVQLRIAADGGHPLLRLDAYRLRSYIRCDSAPRLRWRGLGPRKEQAWADDTTFSRHCCSHLVQWLAYHCAHLPSHAIWGFFL